MSDIVFECPLCGASLEVGADAIGMQVDCPECSKQITIQVSKPPEPETKAATIAESDETSAAEIEPGKLVAESAPRAPEKTHAMNLDEFRKLLEETAQAMAAQLEKAASETRVALE